MTAGARWFLLATILLPALCCGQEGQGWAALRLASVDLSGARLYYETGLAGQVDVFLRAYRQFQTDRVAHESAIRALRENSDEILAEIDRVVGSSPSEAQNAYRKRFFISVLETGEFPPGLNIYLVTKETTKEYLRRGGALPNSSYDKAADTVTFSQSLPRGEGSRGRKLEIPCPVEGPESVEQESRALFAMLLELSSPWGPAFHETVELAILGRLRPRPGGPYFRWFSDGFANAVTIRLLREHLGAEAARRFAAGHDAARFADIEKYANLSYWMGADYCIDTPLESEGRLGQARYAFATMEANRLIEKHGLGCVADILDKARVSRGGDSRDLFRAVKEVTGEDLQARFKRYQPFETEEACIKHYSEHFNAALDRKDYAEALPALLRVLELRGPTKDPRFYGNAALILYRMGHENMGDRAVLKQVDLHKRGGNAVACIIMHKLFLDYARLCDNLRKAVPSAQEVLKAEPGYVPALAVEMVRLGEAGEIAKAKETARRILELEKDTDSPWRKITEQVLGGGQE